MSTTVNPEYSPAVMDAIARIRREGGATATVAWMTTTADGGVEIFESVGLPDYDALALAKDIEFNCARRDPVVAASLVLTTTTGRCMKADEIKAATF